MVLLGHSLQENLDCNYNDYQDQSNHRNQNFIIKFDILSHHHHLNQYIFLVHFLNR